MAGVREVKSRIKTVRNIQQITKAMKMVAAARIRRAEMRLKAARPYTQKLREALEELTAAMGEGIHPLMEERPVKRVGLVIISADKGLAGSFSTNLFKRMQVAMGELPKGVENPLVVFGNKAKRYLDRRKIKIEREFTGFTASYEEAREVAAIVTEWFKSGQVDKVVCVYTRMVSAMQQTPEMVQVLPMVRPTTTQSTQSVDYIFEPSPEVALSTIIPRYVEAMFLTLLLESRAAELAARLKAMTAATDNADSLASALTLQYFRARQDQITRELIEISSGAASLSK